MAGIVVNSIIGGKKTIYDELSEEEDIECMHVPFHDTSTTRKVCGRAGCINGSNNQAGRITFFCSRCRVALCITKEKYDGASNMKNCWFLFHSDKNNRKGYGKNKKVEEEEE